MKNIDAIFLVAGNWLHLLTDAAGQEKNTSIDGFLVISTCSVCFRVSRNKDARSSFKVFCEEWGACVLEMLVG